MDFLARVRGRAFFVFGIRCSGCTACVYIMRIEKLRIIVYHSLLTSLRTALISFAHLIASTLLP